jgi:mono/diheme cytochrome c family protein
MRPDPALFVTIPGSTRRRARSGPLYALLLPLLFTAAGVCADEDSVAQGAKLYQLYCTECHGRDGRAQMDVISDATDLTDPQAYYSGSTREDIFTSIDKGAGVAMPAWGAQLGGDDNIWSLVDFIQSLWVDQ